MDGRAWALVALTLTTACSLKSMAVNTIADTLAEGTDVYASDGDPELVRDALPFSLKTIESLLASSPEHEELLLSACSGFTQYANAFIHSEAERVEFEDYTRALEMRERARKMYVRARDYCLRRLDVEYAGMSERLRVDPETAVQMADEEDVPVLYWLGGSWGLAISLGLDRPEMVADLPAVRALMTRALALDEGYGNGAIHGAMLVLESVPEAMGGSPERARQHFERALDLSGGQDASLYVTLATSIAQPGQDRREFTALLEQALAVDPDQNENLRLSNLIAQRRARLLLDHLDDLFLEPIAEEETPR